jgi:hypothetical protein
MVIVPLYKRWEALTAQQWWLIYLLAIFLTVTLMLILVPAIVGLLYLNQLAAWPWIQWWVYGASAWLGLIPTVIMWQAARYMARSTRRRGQFTVPPDWFTWSRSHDSQRPPH